MENLLDRRLILEVTNTNTFGMHVSSETKDCDVLVQSRDVV
jgi:hypothetical protein